MRSKILLLFVVSLAFVFSAQAQNVKESESSVALLDKTAEATIVFESRAENFDGKISLQLLDEKNAVRAQTSQNTKIKRGTATYKISFPIGNLLKTVENEIVWYRLKYLIADGVGNTKSQGIISLSELLRDIFELRVAAAENIYSGQLYRVKIRAIQPSTKLPVKNVKIEAALELSIDTESDENKINLSAKKETDGEGFATLDFKIAPGIKLDNDAELKITGKKNGIVREIREDLETLETKGSVFLTTDKPIYQPGQDFKVRALYFDNNNTVVTNNNLEFSIKSEDDLVLYKETVKTSDFGIAAISWKIPENAKLGNYRVDIDNEESDELGTQNFKVTRYGLPNFSVNAKPDKTFYLPIDTEAEVSINADYLFGRPVLKGKVRVVQENERRWNYREQKYDVEERQTFEGETDAKGKFVAKLNLNEEIAELKSDSWRRFEDLNFAVYFTDLTTNKTEQKRFNIRLTREPIHIYLIGNRHNENPNLPFTSYVSTFYADGTPAVCDVAISSGDKTISILETNALGAGKVKFDSPKRSDQNRFYFTITARDKNGQTGTLDESNYFDGSDELKIETDKTIFKPGESVKINLLSTKKNALVYVDIVKDWSVVESRFVKLNDGRGDLKIPYNPNFKGELTVAAYFPMEKEKQYYYSDDLVRDARGIIFPEQQNLKLEAKFSDAVYKPNEEASVKFSVFDGIGKAVESALGIVVFDKAVEERARTDAEFSSYFSRFYALLGSSKSFGAITVKDLNELDLSKPISDEMQLAAEVMLVNNDYYPQIYRTRFDQTEANSLYAEFFKNQFSPLEEILKKQFKKDYAHPTDKNSLKQILSANGVNFDGIFDPWGQNYRASFATEKTQNIVKFETAGADKQFGTKDDFVVSTLSFAYFTPFGRAIDAAVENYHERSGKFILDTEILKAELLTQNVNLDELKDRWNRSYRIDFEVSGRNYVVRFYSYGANGYFEPNSYKTDDFTAWQSSIDYFAETEAKINRVLSETVNIGKRDFPKDTATFIQFLEENNIDFAKIRDGYGEPVYLIYGRQYRHADKNTVVNGTQQITPVTEEIAVFALRSKGANGSTSSTDFADDFDLAAFSSVLNVQSKDTKFEKTDFKNISFSGANGAIRGKVLDANGAVIPGAKATATSENDATQIFTATTNDEGVFLIENIASGSYLVRINASAFRSSIYTGIQVRSQNLIEMNTTLEVGGVSEVVNITAEAASVDPTDSKVEMSVDGQQISSLPKGTNFSSLLKLQPGNVGKNEITSSQKNSTPRLREYFPETLVWNPELITDKNGKAEMKFKLADNITTWKLYSIASTKNGKIGITEKEIQAFQAFFVDLDPPKFLTIGDEIYLPAQVRNYTDAKQKVGVTMTKADWFSFLSLEKQNVEVASGESENAVFGFRANASIKDGKQSVTAIAQKESDAIEKTVTVRPNGQEIIKTDSKLFRNSQIFDISFPANALPDTRQAEVKIYPNLFSHVAESVEGLLKRPYGCGEQTISSTYPNLMILKFIKIDNKLRSTADGFLRKGYERLLGYQLANGGFSYWGGKDEADIALTAYAIRFLSDAKEFIEVDENVAIRAHNWLISKQQADGSFQKKYHYETNVDSNQTKLLTAYVARILAIEKAKNGGKLNQNVENALQKSFAYLRARNNEIDDPHALVLFGLASSDAGNIEDANAIAERLKKIAISENDTVYWNLETSTPFYGWGTAGRIETTALVVQLLSKSQTSNFKSQVENSSELISKGTLFLLKNKDRYGVWHSTQTTINVLDAFLTTLTNKENESNASANVQIFLNGESLQNFVISSEQIAPITLNLSDKLNATENRLEIKSSVSSPIMSQVVANHYINWRIAESSNQNTNGARQLRLDYKCDKQTAEIMQEISCSVEVERVGFKGYGMILAEIGTLPGADVSRESLEEAVRNDWSLNRYDILPDRIIFYLWSKSGGTKFNFKFKPRYGINANTPASVVYDYYNPEAQALVAPLKFSIK